MMSGSALDYAVNFPRERKLDVGQVPGSSQFQLPRQQIRNWHYELLNDQIAIQVFLQHR
jgi:hypothetical protein